ncbi:MAG TPA: heme biosynthesis HemY N-terminal domain-containing protein [Casimicrobiaceae bacterium]|nr:heme biosynthesis HemY N-terminal domain-containing protein [Casimicrobiaceae bacterium]
MRFLFWFLLLAAAAVAAAIAVELNAGYALLVAPPYRIELSLNLLLLLAVVGFVALYAGIRLAVRTARMPQTVRAWRRRQKLERARAAQDGAVIALIEGRYGKAQQRALEALAIPGSTGLNAMVGARAAIDVRDFDAAEALLNRPDAQGPSLAVPRLMLRAEIALDQGQPQLALDILRDLRREAGMHTAALRLELRCLQAARRWADIPPLLDQLVKRKVFDGVQAEHVRVSAQSEQLKALAQDVAGLTDCWNRLPEPARRHPKIAAAAARSFLQVGADREASEILAESLERDWDSGLVELYAECRPADAMRQLEQAERWLRTHNHDPALLHALGILCQREELWGKAQTYFEASLALDDGWRAHLALGEMLGRLGRDAEANAHLVAALKLATAELRS